MPKKTKDLIKKVPKVTEEQKEEKFKQQINLLNEIVKIKLAPSSIDGIGVFTLRDIKKDEKLYTDIIPHQFDLPYERFGELNEGLSEIILGHFPLVLDGSHFLYPVTKMSAYLNHSNTPNYDSVNDVALVDIPKGTEVTEDYRLIKNYEKVFNNISFDN